MTSARSTRASARSGVKEASEKRSSKSIKQVRKWQRKLCTIEDTSLKVMKWVYAEIDENPANNKNTNSDTKKLNKN